MSITTVLFDLDGTLLPMDLEEFVKGYLTLLAKKLAPYGYDPKQLMNTIWAGTGAMVKNDGSRTNEAAFWEVFAQVYGEKTRTDKPLFDEFYEKEFNEAKVFCGYNPAAAETVHQLQQMGYRIVLATNPLFPATATEARIRWAGLEPTDFALYTTYENSHSSKPNPAYYQEILHRLHVQPEECLMVGNDVSEDMVAGELGIHTFLLTDCLINKDGVDISRFPNGSFYQLMEYLGNF